MSGWCGPGGALVGATQLQTLKRNPTVDTCSCSAASAAGFCVRRQARRAFVFGGKRGGLIKVLWHDGQGLCLLAKRLERGRFVWPRTEGEAVMITPAQLGYLLAGAAWLSAGGHRLAIAAAVMAA
jgi:hypothetical protein